MILYDAPENKTYGTIMDFIRQIRKRLRYDGRTLAVEAMLQEKGAGYEGEGGCAVLLEAFIDNGKKSHVVHLAITTKPFIDLKATVVMEAICSFSVKVSDEDYGLYRLWFDTKIDNWQTHLLTTKDRAELERRINEEWEKGTEGTFFRK
jgi:hypothetical protein